MATIRRADLQAAEWLSLGSPVTKANRPELLRLRDLGVLTFQLDGNSTIALTGYIVTMTERAIAALRAMRAKESS